MSVEVSRPAEGATVALAREVERLAVGGRTTPETILLAKHGIAGELRRLAREIGR